MKFSPRELASFGIFGDPKKRQQFAKNQTHKMLTKEENQQRNAQRCKQYYHTHKKSVVNQREVGADVPTFENGDVSIYYETHGDGFPVLLIAPGGMRSAVSFWERTPWNPIEDLSGEFRVIAMDQRNAGSSTAPIRADDGWHVYTRDQLALLDHLGVASLRLMTNNPRKVEALTRDGVEISERLPITTGLNPHNEQYLSTKAGKLGHMLGQLHQAETEPGDV